MRRGLTGKQFGLEMVEVADRVEIRGIDPRRLSKGDLGKIGHKPKPILALVRAFCIQCCGDNVQEVKHCTARACPLWPYRMGENPFKGRMDLDPADRDRRRQHMKAIRQRK